MGVRRGSGGGAEIGGVDAMRDDVEAFGGDALGEEPVPLDSAHEDDGVETGEAAGAADDFGQLVGGLVLLFAWVTHRLLYQ
jgi:hypothetical protein